MEERPTFQIKVRFSIVFRLDFERCVASVRKRILEPVLTVIRRIKSDAPSSLQGIFSIRSLRWIAKLAVIVAVVLVSHWLVAATNDAFTFGLSSGCRETLAEFFGIYILQGAGFFK